MKPEFSIVIPVFHGAKTLPDLCNRIAKVFNNISQNYEIILVDDASTDDSWQVMQKLRKGDAKIKLIQQMRNFGQHQALLCGLRHSVGDFVITMDDDLQHLPEEIPKLITTIKADDSNDVVVGAYITKKHSWFRNLGTKLINDTTSHIFGKDPKLQLTSFRIIRRHIVDELNKNKSSSPRIGLILLTITKKISSVPVQHHTRLHGCSGYSFPRMVANTLDNILTYSSLPLRLVSYVGFASSFLSFLLGIYYVLKYFLKGIGVTGWTTTILLLLFCFGVLLFSMGIVGEYLIRIMREVTNQPQYIIRKKEF
ncbi:MAG: glycosyltransferase family 2 protein [Deltaproteobacteria bacterium]|nr:glycosyltransferase family 2 protein [Deltaproteobacteria bacterium]